MRHTLAWILTLALLMLPGCASEEKTLEPAICFRADLLNAGGCSFTAQVSADYDDLVYELTMTCTSDDQVTRITVTDPSSISGITADIANATGTVTFDGMALDFGVLADGRLAPLAAPGIAVESWISAYIASAGEEDDSYRVCYENGYEDEKIIIDTWFTPEGKIPCYAELRTDSRCLVKLTITDFQLT